MQINDDNLLDILDKIDTIVKNEKKSTDKQCKICNSSNLVLVNERNLYVCNNCGCDCFEFFDNNDNNYYDEYNNSSIQINSFFPKSSLSCNSYLPYYSKINILRYWGQVPYKERSLSEVLNDIENKCKHFKISKAVIDNTKILYKNIRDMKYNKKDSEKYIIIRGINRKQIIAACFYFGALLQKSPRSAKEVAEIFNLELKQITKGCRKFLEIMKDTYIIFDIKPCQGIDYIKRFCIKLNLSNDIITLSEKIAKNCALLSIVIDHQVTSIAAACILFACNLNDININKKTISSCFNISDVTILKTYKKIILFEKIVIDDDLTEKFYNQVQKDFYELNKDNVPEDSYDETDIIKVIPNKNKLKNKKKLNKKNNPDEIQEKKKRGRPRLKPLV